MADVPDDAIVGRIEHGVESDRELDDTEPGAKVAAGYGDRVDHLGPQLVGEFAQLIARHILERAWRGDGIEQGG